MNYKQAFIKTGEGSVREILIALLDEAGYEGFEETADGLFAFIPEASFNVEILNNILDPMALVAELSLIVKRNWNTDWEQNFSPVIVEDFCTVRADFHQLEANTPYEIIITPKMSFGTGHHATTQLMIMMMQGIDFKDRKVLDFGTGTGILAILAEKLGASFILGIDNDEWSYENAMENMERNGTRRTEMRLGSLENVQERGFDILLANINRHILLQYMDSLYQLLKPGALLLLSGLLKEDRDIILSATTGCGLNLVNENEMSNWIVLCFVK